MLPDAINCENDKDDMLLAKHDLQQVAHAPWIDQMSGELWQ